MKRRVLISGTMLLLTSMLLSLTGPSTGTLAHNPSERKGPYEVWILDQSDTTADGGGTLYIYQDEELESDNPAGAVPEVIDLGGAARDLCLAESGTAPRRRLHRVWPSTASTPSAIPTSPRSRPPN